MNQHDDQHDDDLIDLGSVSAETKGPPNKTSDGVGGLNGAGLSND